MIFLNEKALNFLRKKEYNLKISIKTISCG